ncbi:SAP-like protein BP-73 [Pyrus ussuriensis x Pyrus communis]|uniref:SAP-like protein BP-73 n=1 Tax=Pyrus ussuriensis x Pyrus communis TaxID=2448454 RepID=A0A5N5IDS9_9ROSA|nr:SAP-like protein BP-73 [Pyrus ussuriensis x Pyrus communis]
MGASGLQYDSVLRFPTFFSFSKQPKLGNPIFSLKDVSSLFERKELHLTVTCSIGSQGNGRDQPPRRRSERANKDGSKKRGSRKSNANQEEIISLFRRIQTSISKEGSVDDEKISADDYEDRPHSDSILRALHGLRNPKGKADEKEGKKVFTRRIDTREEQMQSNPPVAEFKLTRPPSKFVKRSPIPHPSTPRSQLLELDNGATPSATGRSGAEELDLVRVEEMKLPELKELAKSRGMRGYSKLKKRELVKLLKS